MNVATSKWTLDTNGSEGAASLSTPRRIEYPHYTSIHLVHLSTLIKPRYAEQVISSLKCQRP